MTSAKKKLQQAREEEVRTEMLELVAGTGTWEAQGVNPLCSTPCAH